MADMSALERALVNADAAGDVEAARVLAGEIKRLRSADVPAPDKYQQAAIEERDALKAKGVDTGAGLTRRLAQGATLNTADEIMAGLTTPLEMIKRGTFSPREGYNYAKAREDLILDDARKNTGALGMIAEIGGGIGTGLGAAQAGLSFARGLAPNAGLLGRSAASAGDSAAFGALAGAGEGNSVGERFNNALLGGGVGGAVGAVAPGAISLLGSAVSPIISNIRARFNPTGFAQSQVARGIHESGRTPNQLSLDMVQAANEGQGNYTLADALGNAGQRMLSTTTRAPGRARTDVLEFLDQRQAGQGRRVAGALAEGFDSPQTAAQTRTAMENARAVAADAEYGAVRNGAANSRVDVVPAINQIDQIIGTGPGQQLTAANDTVEGLLRPFRERLARVNPDDFEAVQRIRVDMSDAVQGSLGTNRGRLLRQALSRLDSALEGASPGFRQANQNFAQRTRNIEAVDTGRAAALRGRTEDTIPTFQRLTPEGQRAYRAGYVDPLIEQAQSAAGLGTNKARPLINDAFTDEAAAMAPGNAMMQRRIGRENTMFQTRHAASGNSKTVENAADDAAMGIDPTLVGSLVSQVGTGNWGGALRTILGAGQNALTGNTPAVRQAVADILLQRGANMSPAALQRMVDETVQRIQRVQQMARAVGRGAAGGLAVATPAANRR